MQPRVYNGVSTACICNIYMTYIHRRCIYAVYARRVYIYIFIPRIHAAYIYVARAQAHVRRAPAPRAECAQCILFALTTTALKPSELWSPRVHENTAYIYIYIYTPYTSRIYAVSTLYIRRIYTPYIRRTHAVYIYIYAPCIFGL